MQKFTKVKKRGRPPKKGMQFVVAIHERNEESLYKVIANSLPQNRRYKIVNLIATIEYTDNSSKVQPPEGK